MFSSLRTHIPLLSRLAPDEQNPVIYLDNAATTHKPQVVLDAMNTFYTQSNANVHRGAHFLADAATQAYEDARATVAQFINAKPHEVVFTSGATAALNTIAHAWALNHVTAGDVIVLSPLEHHANLLPWQLVAEKTNAHIRFLDLTADGLIDESTIKNVIDDRVKLVAITHISNAIGVHLPVKNIVEAAQAVGAVTVLDAAQSAPHLKIDVQKLAVDVLVFSGHKLMGPTGIGVLYVKETLHNQLQAHFRGGGMVFSVNEAHASWAPMPYLLEAGTPPVAQAVGLAAAINYLNTHIDYNLLHKHYRLLMARLLDGLQSHPGVTIIGPRDHLQQKSHLVSFVIQDTHAHDVAAFFSLHGICVRAGHHCAQPLAARLGYPVSVRVSLYWYTTLQEIEVFLEKLKLFFSIE